MRVLVCYYVRSDSGAQRTDTRVRQHGVGIVVGELAGWGMRYLGDRRGYLSVLGMLSGRCRTALIVVPWGKGIRFSCRASISSSAERQLRP